MNKHIFQQGLPIHRPPPAAIYVDASLTGCGIKSPLMETAGFWRKEEQHLSINVRELKTILFALSLHANTYARTAIDLYTDSITALKYVTKQGGTSSPTASSSDQGGDDHGEHDSLFPPHCGGTKCGCGPPTVSRHTPTYEWILPKTYLRQIARHWKFLPTIDAFASWVNHRLPQFWSYRPDPQAKATNAFDQVWPRSGLYLHPPWALIPKVIQHLKHHQVTKAILVATSHAPCDSSSHSSQRLHKKDFYRMAVIRAHYASLGLHQSELSFLENQTRKSTTIAYDRLWMVWVTWCLKRRPQVKPTDYNPILVTQWLSSIKTMATSTLNGYKSAISSVFNLLYPDRTPLAAHHLIKSLVKAHKQLPRAIQDYDRQIWDVSLLLRFVEQMGVMENLPLIDLQLKTIILVAVATMWRPRSDLGRLQFRDIHFVHQEGVLIGVNLLARQPKEAESKTSYLTTLKHNSSLCAVTTLFFFHQQTTSIRNNLPPDHTCFLAYIQHHLNSTRSIKESTVAGLPTAAMYKAGVPKKFSAHSIRAAASTAAYRQGAHIQDIKLHANWSPSSKAFENHYLKLCQPYLQAESMLNRVFLGEAANRTTSEVEAETSTVV